MLSLFVAHIIISITCFSGGFIFYKIFSSKSSQRPALFYLLSGLIFLTCITQIIVLFSPIQIYIQVLLVIFPLLIAFTRWKEFKQIVKDLFNISSWSVLSIILLSIVWLIVLLFSAGPVIMDDTESYHIQSIKWIQEYGSVPGLVNLHERFGFNSSWFSSVSLFSFSGTTTGGYSVLNSTLSLWFIYWLISIINLQLKDKNLTAAIAALIVFACCIIVWPLIRGNAATSNYDFITTLVVVVLFSEIFFSKDFSPSIEWIIWPAYLFTVRIINFPFLLLSVIAIIFFIKKNKFRRLLLPIACCLLLIIPFVARNVIIAGYPFYPSTYFDIANVDWKPDQQMTERLIEYIKYYNRVSTTFLEIEQTKALGAGWVPYWFKYLFLFDKVLLIAGIAGVLLSAIKLFTKKNKIEIVLLPICSAWLICWFIISPDPRFIYGILLFGIFLLSYHFISIVKNQQLRKHILNGTFIIMIAGISFYVFSKIWKQNEYRNWIIPTSLPQPLYKEIMIDNITFRIPEPINNNWNARCYSIELPCLYKIDPRLKPRGKSIRDGFRLEK